MTYMVLEDVCKIYNNGTNLEVNALKNINLEINKGDFVVFEGRSGSGKSTLLNILGCIDYLTSGKYVLDGIDVSSLNNKGLAKIRNKKIGFVLQDFGIIPNRTVLENVSIPLYFSNTPLRDIKSKCINALSVVGLGEYTAKRVSQLSGGQKQRVAIARAIVNNPDIILADEPTGSLDNKTTIEMMDFFKTLNDKGVTIIIVTHDKTVTGYCKSKYIIDDGYII